MSTDIVGQHMCKHTSEAAVQDVLSDEQDSSKQVELLISLTVFQRHTLKILQVGQHLHLVK